MTDKEAINALLNEITFSVRCKSVYATVNVNLLTRVLAVACRKQAELETLKAHEEKEHQYCKNVCEPKYKAEIERLQIEKEKLRCVIEDLSNNTEHAKAEAIKEFAERLKAKSLNSYRYDYKKNISIQKKFVDTEDIDNLVKEMVGEE